MIIYANGSFKGLIKIFDDERIKLLDELKHLKKRTTKYIAINTDHAYVTTLSAFDENYKVVGTIVGNNACYIHAALKQQISPGWVNVEIDSIIDIFEDSDIID